jgi:hypothetical protein
MQADLDRPPRRFGREPEADPLQLGVIGDDRMTFRDGGQDRVGALRLAVRARLECGPQRPPRALEHDLRDPERTVGLVDFDRAGGELGEHRHGGDEPQPAPARASPLPLDPKSLQIPSATHSAPPPDDRECAGAPTPLQRCGLPCPRGLSRRLCWASIP